jgi:diacylglycerol kinase (ATP)
MNAMRMLFVVNPAAGAGRAARRWAGLAQLLAHHGLAGDTVMTRHPGEAIDLAKQAAGVFEAVVAVGGDGTVLEVASGLLAANSTTVLGVIPLGTGNDTPDALGLRREVEAVAALKAGQTRPVDAIRVRCQKAGAVCELHALSFAAVGIVGELLKQTTPLVKQLFGRRLAYPVGLLRALWSYRPPRMRVRWDGGSREDRFLFVSASNAEAAGGGMKIAPGARIDDGAMNLNLIEAVPRLEALRQLRRLCQGRHLPHPRIHYTPARNLSVECDPPIEVLADGDRVGFTPASLELIPGAIRVLR